MENNKTHEPEAATFIFEELQHIATLVLTDARTNPTDGKTSGTEAGASDYRRAYQQLNRIFIISLDQKTNLAGIRFGGPFAKVDYLLKEYKAPRYLRATINDARVRFRKMRGLDQQTLVDNFWYDFKAVSQFVGLVFQVPVPAVLEVRFPQGRTIQRGKLAAECLRIIVNRWDDTFIYAEADEEGTEEVKVFYAGPSDNYVYKEWDWSYLRDLLTENCQLNLVRPREKDGVLYPELVIFEPDYLVDVSAIASCFESYSHSPVIHLLNKLKPTPVTPPIILGNLASQFLDEALYLYPETCSYKQSVQQFFKENALSLLTGGVDDSFHKNAQIQKQNIQNVIHNVLPKVFWNDGMKKFDASEVIVEPSFFSEMLGIQGRMDFLQLDQRILIEQKSGKAAFPEQDPPRPLEKHQVQVLLYLMLLRYNNRALYEKNGQNVHMMLLYSKYKNGLVDFGSSAPELMFEAIKLRNGIVANEYRYSKGGIRSLDSLTSDALNEKGLRGMLWERYQKPQLDALLSPIHTASELERAYYYRFLTFIETEHLMTKVGNQTKENSGFADKWHSTLDEKLLAGNIYCDLDLLSPTATERDRVGQVTLRFTQRADTDISNFRPGDIVILYPYTEGTEPDARQTMVFRATIERIGGDRLTLSLRASQANANVFWYQGRKKWAIEHDFFESSFSSLYHGMHAFLSAPQERKDLLLLQRAPQCDKTVALTGDYGNFNTLALKASQARDLFLIIGPPGTGKTSYGLMNTLQEELLSSARSSVLLLSYTNRAVDEICSKLVEAGIDYIRIGGRFSCEEAYRSSLIDSKVQACQNMDELRALIDHTRVFVGTTTSFNSHVNLFQVKQFSLAIIDEASQILEPHLIGLLSATSPDGCCAIKKMVLIGDHKQLPAVVQQKEEDSLVEEPILRDIHLTNCRLSLFERLLRQYRDNPDVVYMLTRQGRMHHDIAQFPNHTFYQNRLEVVPCPHQNIVLPKQGKGIHGIDDILTTRRISFVAIPPPEHSPSDKVNSNEALAIAATVERIYQLNAQTFSPTQTVGVIVPYRNQIAEVRKAVEKSGIDALRDITIDTVERYQGSQRDYIIYGFTIQKYYQLNFLTNNVFEEDGSIIDRKLNVAMTRAREHLLLFGDPELLANDITFSKLMAYVRSEHSYFSVSLSHYLSGRFAVPTTSPTTASWVEKT